MGDPTEHELDLICRLCDVNQDRVVWALCEQCGIPRVLHHSDILLFDTDDGSTRPAVCVIERYLPLDFHPGAILEALPSPTPAFIAAFECEDIDESIIFRDDADHLAEWAALAMSPRDVDEAKRHELVSELLTHNIAAAHNADAVASCRCPGCLSAPPSADALAVSARLLVEQAKAARTASSALHLASGITHLSLGIDGYLVISDYSSRVGLLGAPFFSGYVSREFSKSVRAVYVECPCRMGCIGQGEALRSRF